MKSEECFAKLAEFKHKIVVAQAGGIINEIERLDQEMRHFQFSTSFD